MEKIIKDTDNQLPDNSRRDFLKKLALLGVAAVSSGLFFGEKDLNAMASPSPEASGTCSTSYSCSGSQGQCGTSYGCSGGGGKCGTSYECAGGGGKCGTSYSCGGS